MYVFDDNPINVKLLFNKQGHTEYELYLQKIINPSSYLQSLLSKQKCQGTHGFEPWTYRTAADCSTTELYPQL